MRIIFFILVVFIGFSCESESLELSSSSTSLLKQATLEKTQTNVLQSVEVGRIVDGKHLISFDNALLKSRWSAFINKHSAIKVAITSIRITENNGALFLEGKDSKNNTNSLITLSVENNIIYEARIDGGSCTVTCSACESTGPDSAGECEPKIKNGKSYCTSCSKGTCTKSVSCDQRPILREEWELELQIGD